MPLGPQAPRPAPTTRGCPAGVGVPSNSLPTVEPASPAKTAAPATFEQLSPRQRPDHPRCQPPRADAVVNRAGWAPARIRPARTNRPPVRRSAAARRKRACTALPDPRGRPATNATIAVVNPGCRRLGSAVKLYPTGVAESTDTIARVRDVRWPRRSIPTPGEHARRHDQQNRADHPHPATGPLADRLMAQDLARQTGPSCRLHGVQQSACMKAWQACTSSASHVTALQLDEVPIPMPGDGEIAGAGRNDHARLQRRRRRARSLPDRESSPSLHPRAWRCWESSRTAGAGAERLDHGRRRGGHTQWRFRRVRRVGRRSERHGIRDAAAGRVRGQQAAAVYFSLHLSWLALHDRASSPAGRDRLICHSRRRVAGSVQRPYQLAAVAGARVIATAGSEAKLELCSARWESSVNSSYYYREHQFVEAVMQATKRAPRSMWPSTPSGAPRRPTFRCMAFNGRHLLV